MRSDPYPRAREVRRPDGDIDQFAPLSGGLCDFCSVQVVAWCYPANSFLLEPYSWASVGNWAACSPCSDLIEAGDFAGLTRRCSDVQAPRIEAALGRRTSQREQREHEAQVTTLHAAFAANRCGERHPNHPMPPEGIVGPHEYPTTPTRGETQHVQER